METTAPPVQKAETLQIIRSLFLLCASAHRFLFLVENVALSLVQARGPGPGRRVRGGGRRQGG